MKVLKKTVPLWALVLIVVVSASAVAAALIVQRNINLSMTIKPVLGMQVFDTDGSTPLSAVPLGEFYRGDKKTFPLTYPTDTYFVKNTGEANVWIKYDVGTQPTGVLIRVYVNGGLLTKNTIYATPLPGDTAWTMYFEIEASGTAGFGSFSPRLEFYAYDSASG